MRKYDISRIAAASCPSVPLTPMPVAHDQTRQASLSELSGEHHRRPRRFHPGQGVTHASVGEWKAMPELSEQLPISPVSLAADTAYSAGQFRQILILLEGGITAYIPIHPVQENALVSKRDFAYHGDHLVCR